MSLHGKRCQPGNNSYRPVEKRSKIEKKIFHIATTVGKLSSRATFLSHRQNKVRVFLVKNWHMQMRWVTKDTSLRAPSFGHQIEVTWPKGKPGHAFSSFGPPPFLEIGPPDTFSDRLCMRQKFPPPLKTSRRGTPRKVSPRGVKIATLSSCGGRAFSVHMPIFRAMIDRWRNSRAQESVLKNSFKNPFM